MRPNALSRPVLLEFSYFPGRPTSPSHSFWRPQASTASFQPALAPGTKKPTCYRRVTSPSSHKLVPLIFFSSSRVKLHVPKLVQMLHVRLLHSVKRRMSPALANPGSESERANKRMSFQKRECNKVDVRPTEVKSSISCPFSTSGVPATLQITMLQMYPLVYFGRHEYFERRHICVNYPHKERQPGVTQTES